jgi:hypothetical protein
MNSFGRKLWTIVSPDRRARDEARGWNGWISIDPLHVVGGRGR